MTEPLLRDCLTHLQAALKALSLYPERHPGIQEPLQSFSQGLSTLHEADRSLILGVIDDVLVFDEIPFYETDTIWRTLFSALQERGIESISLQPGIEPEEILGILQVLKGGEPGDLATQWKSHDIRHASYREAIDGDDLRATAQRTYHESLAVVVDLMTELRVGKIPQSRAVIDVIDAMRDVVLQDASALLGMAMMKSYDEYTYNHSVNVSIFCLSLGRHLELPPAELRVFGLSGLLHDMGKVRTKEAILKKPGALDDDELRVMQLHPELGAEILESMQDIHPDAHAMVLQHHLRCDGTGYPEHARKEIHPLAEGVGLADCYDALTTTRPYQRSRHPGEAIRVLHRCAGKAYRPELVQQFVDMLGIYPVGETVRLATGEIGLVIANNSLDATRPKIRLVRDRDGNIEAQRTLIDLADPLEAKRAIIAPLDPLAKGIDVATLLEEEMETNLP